MSLIAVVGDHDCELEVLYASEAHYLVDVAYSFVTLELAIKAAESCESISIVLDGLIPTANDSERLQSSWNFRELLGMSRCNVRPQGGVWDFRDTFFRPRLLTNRSYEGPDEWREIAVVRDGRDVRYVGRVAHVPEFRRKRFVGAGSLTLLTLNEAVIVAGEIHVLRLGFFLKRRTRAARRRIVSWLRGLTAYRPQQSFVIRFYSYGDEDEAALRQFGVAERLRRSMLHLTLAPFVELAGGLREYADDATSDIWVVGYGPGSATVRLPAMRLDEFALARRATLGLFTHEEEDEESPFWESHFYPRLHNVELQRQTQVRPRSGNGIWWDAEFPGITVRGYAEALVPSMSALAILLAVGGAMVSGWPGQVAPILVPVVLIGNYVALWARYNVPAWRRLFERHSRRR